MRFGNYSESGTILVQLRFATGLLTMGLLVGGCLSAQVSELREHADKIGPGEGVTILLHYHSRSPSAEARESEARDVEQEIVGCVTNAVRRAHPRLRIVPPDEFRRVAFPDLPHAAAPRSVEYLSVLADHPIFRQRIAPLNLRYVIAVGGATAHSDAIGVIGVAAIWVWSRHSRLAAAVLDLKQGGSATIAEATAEGVGTAVWFILPIGVPTRTETHACDDLGRRIAEFLSAAEPPKRP